MQQLEILVAAPSLCSPFSIASLVLKTRKLKTYCTPILNRMLSASDLGAVVLVDGLIVVIVAVVVVVRLIVALVVVVEVVVMFVMLVVVVVVVDEVELLVVVVTVVVSSVVALVLPTVPSFFVLVLFQFIIE
jgi:hypothetical protein